MARHDGSELFLDPSSVLRPRREKVIMPLDGDIAQAVLLLADYFPFMFRQRFIEQLFSILLTSLVSDDVEAHTDAMERIVDQTEMTKGRETSKFWGEYMMLQTYFFDTYELDIDFKEALENTLPSDLRIWPEELFLVRWSKEANYILIE